MLQGVHIVNENAIILKAIQFYTKEMTGDKQLLDLLYKLWYIAKTRTVYRRKAHNLSVDSCVAPWFALTSQVTLQCFISQFQSASKDKGLHLYIPKRFTGNGGI